MGEICIKIIENIEINGWSLEIIDGIMGTYEIINER
jgi:hypothetical protein